MADTLPRRQRLMDAGMRLFASQGFEATTVGEIEVAAGLAPRRGALYKHFDSKQALLEEAVRADLDMAALGARQIENVDLSSLASADLAVLEPFVQTVGQWFLEEMDRLEDLTRVFEHDSGRLGPLTDEVRENLVDLSYRATVRILRAIAPQSRDPEAAALMILGPLVALRRTTWTYQAPPLGLTDDRTLECWTRTALCIIDTLRCDTA